MITKKVDTDITVVLDRSGSMQSVKKATIDGFNEFLRGQKAEEGSAKISLVQFDNKYEHVFKSLPLKDAPYLNDDTFIPRGMTALNDAIGRTIDKVGERLAKLSAKNRPDNVILVILTDGYENASTDYSTEKVASMVKHQRDKYNWKFIFLGANQDTILTAKTYNFAQGQTMSYRNAPAAIGSTFTATSNLVSNLRKGAVGGQSVFSITDREEALK
jgi:uncharacterized protein YegL